MLGFYFVETFMECEILLTSPNKRQHFLMPTKQMTALIKNFIVNFIADITLSAYDDLENLVFFSFWRHLHNVTNSKFGFYFHSFSFSTSTAVGAGAVRAFIIIL